jgi:glycosyl transferase family 1
MMQKALDWRTWTAVARDAVWGMSGTCAPPTVPDPRRDVIVGWPAQLQHPNAAPFVWPLLEGFRRLALVQTREIRQPYEGIVLIDIDLGAGPRRVAIDYFDLTHINETCRAEVDCYFKMQFDRAFTGESRLLPGGYVSSASFLYRYWCRLRETHQSARPSGEVFARFGLRYGADVRRTAITLLEADARFRYVGGTEPRKLSYYLREMARAGVCIDLPGRGPFCYRLVEAMAVGACVIGLPHQARMPTELRPGVEIIYCAEDLSDLTDLCAHYIQDRVAARRVGVAAARYFDAHLHPLPLAAYYLDALSALDSGSGGTGTGSAAAGR